MYRLGQGNIYIDTGQPIPVEPNASEKKLAHLAQQEAARCYRVTMPALVSYAISKGATTRSELKKSLEGYASILKKGRANFRPLFGLEESIDSALHDLAQRKIISDGDPFLVRSQK